MSDKIARLGIVRDPDIMYYIKDGDVWGTPRKQKGQPKGKARKIKPIGIALDYSKYLYFVDADGDVARKERALGGGGRKAKAKAPKAPKAPKPSKTAKPSKAAPSVPTRTTRTGKKSEAQLDREIEECLAQIEKKESGGGNGTKAASKPAAKKTKR